MEAILQREIISNKVITRIFGLLISIILITLSGFVRLPLPFTPVPLTLQTMFVLLTGSLLGSGLGGLSLLSFMLLGVSGLSVFSATGSGLLYLCGPTGGYIFGFILAAFFIGKFAGAVRNKTLTVLLFYGADLIILATGALWLKISLRMSLGQAFLLGVAPFLGGDLLKAFLAAAIYHKLKARAKEIF